MSDTFECGCEPVDVTSNHRPDTDWRHVDSHGHEHRWYAGPEPVAQYDPLVTYTTPTLVQTQNRSLDWIDDDGELHEGFELACRRCGEVVEPGYMADPFRVYIPGLRYYRINGVDVTQEEYERRINDR